MFPDALWVVQVVEVVEAVLPLRLRGSSPGESALAFARMPAMVIARVSAICVNTRSQSSVAALHFSSDVP